MEETSKGIVENCRNNIEFENLPQHLIHHIMNFLPYRDATKFSVLSKTFHSLWLSFPVLHFDPKFFDRAENPYHSFLSFVLKTVHLRCPHHINKSLQRLSVEYHETFASSFPFYIVFDVLLNFALDKNTKEIIFDLPFKAFSNINFRYDSLLRLFSSQFLTSLNLTGVCFSTAEPIILCPKLKELLISFCRGLQTIAVSSLCLEKVNINSCSELEGVQLNGKNVLDFTFNGGLPSEIHNQTHRCQINLSACESIKRMFLRNAEVSRQVIELVTDSLFITNCDLPENLSIHNPSIKKLEMKCNCKMKNFFLSAPNLERFGYHHHSPETQKCSVDFSACVALKVLELEGTTLTDECVSTISDLGCLKKLQISNCHVELKNDKLEELPLRTYSNLREATIDVQNFPTFDYDGSLQVYPMQISSAICKRVSIALPQCNIDPQLWFDNMTQLLACFHHVKDLTVYCFQAEDVIFPKEHVETNRSPLQDLEYMILQTTARAPKRRTVIQLVKSLLWLAPKPMKLTFYSGYNDTLSSLKFEYGNKKAKRKYVAGKRCCFGVPTKCWRHYEPKVDIKGFNAYVTRKLKTFFAP